MNGDKVNRHVCAYSDGELFATDKHTEIQAFQRSGLKAIIGVRVK